MIRFTPLVIFSIALAAPCPATEVITLSLELDDSQLYIRPGENYLLEFNAERELLDISDVRLHVVGTYNNSRSICWQFGNYGGGTWSYTEDAGLLISFRDAGSALCVTQHVFDPSVSEVIAYDIELAFDCTEDAPDWSFLSQGSGVVHLTGLDCNHFPSYPEVCICEHSAMVSSAELIIELGSGTAVERWNWGVLKDRYR